MPGKRCLSCNEDFPAKSKFCSECGEALVLVESGLTQSNIDPLSTLTTASASSFSSGLSVCTPSPPPPAEETTGSPITTHPSLAFSSMQLPSLPLSTLTSPPTPQAMAPSGSSDEQPTSISTSQVHVGASSGAGPPAGTASETPPHSASASQPQHRVSLAPFAPVASSSSTAASPSISTHTSLTDPSAAPTSVFESAIGEPSGSTSPMTLQDYEMVSLWTSTANKSLGQQQQQQQQQQTLRPPPDSRARADQADASSSKSSSDSSITYVAQDASASASFANATEAGGAARGAASNSSSASASPAQRSAAAHELNRSETAPGRDAFHSMQSPSAAGSPLLASAMSRSAIAPGTSPPSVLQVRSPTATPAPVQTQPDMSDKLSQGLNSSGSIENSSGGPSADDTLTGAVADASAAETPAAAAVAVASAVEPTAPFFSLTEIARSVSEAYSSQPATPFADARTGQDDDVPMDDTLDDEAPEVGRKKNASPTPSVESWETIETESEKLVTPPSTPPHSMQPQEQSSPTQSAPTAASQQPIDTDEDTNMSAVTAPEIPDDTEHSEEESPQEGPAVAANRQVGDISDTLESFATFRDAVSFKTIVEVKLSTPEIQQAEPAQSSATQDDDETKLSTLQAATTPAETETSMPTFATLTSSTQPLANLQQSVTNAASVRDESLEPVVAPHTGSTAPPVTGPPPLPPREVRTQPQQLEQQKPATATEKRSSLKDAASPAEDPSQTHRLSLGEPGSALALEPPSPTVQSVPSESVCKLSITGTKELTLTNPSELANRSAPSRPAAFESLSAASNPAQSSTSDRSLPARAATKSPSPSSANKSLSEATVAAQGEASITTAHTLHSPNEEPISKRLRSQSGARKQQGAPPDKAPSAIEDDVEMAAEATDMPSSTPSTAPKQKPTSSKSTTESKNKVQELNELRVIFWMMPGDVKSKPNDQYRIVFEAQFTYLSSHMTPIALGDGKFLYVNQVLFSKNRLNRDKGYKINYRYELIRYSKRLKRDKVVPESRVTGGTDNFTRQLEFRKHGFYDFEIKLYSLGTQ